MTSILSRFARATLRWLDSHTDPMEHLATMPPAKAERLRERFHRVSWMRSLPFLLLHVAAFAVLFTGVSPFALLFAVASYVVRMHAITGWYHRYFSHRTFRTGRVWQFVWAVIGNSTFQRGPLWWAAHHRHHHRHSDLEQDTHSPQRQGFWYSHTLWFFVPANFRTRLELVPDLAKVPELLWLDRFDYVAPLTVLLLVAGLGWLVGHVCPSLHTSAAQLTAWYVLATIAVAHATFTINSCAHLVGSRRYATSDTSRNHFGLALLTLGEGWHNNHHHYQATVRQGFQWWEVDISYYLLRAQAAARLVWDLKGIPERVRHPEAVSATAPGDSPQPLVLLPTARLPAAVIPVPSPALAAAPVRLQPYRRRRRRA